MKLRVPAGACKALKKRTQSAGQHQRQTDRQQGAGRIEMAQLVKGLAVLFRGVPREQLAQKIAVMRRIRMQASA